MGAGVLKSEYYLKFLLSKFNFKKIILSSILFRLLLLDIYFILLILTVTLFANLKGVPVKINLASPLFYFLIYTVFFLNFFYLAGFFMKVLFRFKIVATLGLVLLWMVSIFLIPELNRISLSIKAQQLPTNEEFNLKKHKTLMEFEQKVRDYIKREWDTIKRDKNRNEKRNEIMKRLAYEYQNNEYLLNLSRELVLKKRIERLINNYESMSIIYPSLYYSFISNEISSQGYYGYLDFLEYILKMRTDFLRFYLKKRYEYGDEKLVAYVRKNENIFKAKSYIPKTFWYGMIFTISYCLAMFLVAYSQLKQKVYQT
jgi:ABC-type transport system involved in multi-copper enzyme maturation permease subunit